MKERRIFVRIPKKGLIRYRHMNLPAFAMDFQESVFKNISGGGILFEAPINIAIGAVLKLELELKDWSQHLDEKEALQNFDGKPLKLLGEVVHCEEIIPGRAYDIGIKFLGLDTKYQKAIIDYLQHSFNQS